MATGTTCYPAGSYDPHHLCLASTVPLGPGRRTLALPHFGLVIEANERAFDQRAQDREEGTGFLSVSFLRRAALAATAQDEPVELWIHGDGVPRRYPRFQDAAPVDGGPDLRLRWHGFEESGEQLLEDPDGYEGLRRVLVWARCWEAPCYIGQDGELASPELTIGRMGRHFARSRSWVIRRLEKLRTMGLVCKRGRA